MSRLSKEVAQDLMERGIDIIDLFNSTDWQEDINLYLDREDIEISQYVKFTLVVKVNDEEFYVGALEEEDANKIAVGFGTLRYANYNKELATEDHFLIYAYDEEDEEDEEIIVLIKF